MYQVYDTRKITVKQPSDTDMIVIEDVPPSPVPGEEGNSRAASRGGNKRFCACGCNQEVRGHQGKGQPNRYASGACRVRHHRALKRGIIVTPVNACVILRRNNFDPPLSYSFSYSQLTTSKIHAQVCSATQQMDAATPPAAGRLHLDALWWTAGAETSEREIYRRACCVRSSRLPSLPQASRSYDPPPPLPQLAHS